MAIVEGHLSIRHFDEEKLVSALQELSVNFRVAFAAACAERQLPTYRVFHERTGKGNPLVLRDALDRIWDDLGGRPLAPEEIKTAIDQCLAYMPGETDGGFSQHHAHAEDAAASVAYALRTRLTGEAQEAAWCARRAYESLDSHVVNELDVDPGEPGAEDRIVRHSAIQRELSRQDRDLADLLTLVDHAGEARSAIETLRTRAHEEAASFLEP